MTDPTVPSLTPLERAAYLWWKGLRPVAWNEETHLAQPIVNCKSMNESNLARAIALCVFERWEAK